MLRELAGLTRSAELKELLKKVGHDEGYWAGELAGNLRRLGGSPSKKGQASLRRSLPATPKRTRKSLQGDGALQFSMSQRLT